MSFSWANTDPYKEMKDERYKYMKLYVQERMKQMEYERQVPELDLKNMSNFYLSDKMLDVQISYYEYLSKSLLNDNNVKFNYYNTLANGFSEEDIELYKKRHEYLKKNVPLLKVKFIKLMNSYVKLLKENKILAENQKRLINYINKEVKFIKVGFKSSNYSSRTYKKAKSTYSKYYYDSSSIKPLLRIYNQPRYKRDLDVTKPIILINNKEW